MMSELREGDKVRVLEGDHPYIVGLDGVVDALEPFQGMGEVTVWFENGSRIGFFEAELETVES